jgi:hypothetical protein
MFTLGDLEFTAGLALIVGVVIGWIVCWAVAMHYGERTGEFRAKQALRMRPPVVAMTRLPPGVQAARLETRDASREETEEILGTWRDHVVIPGSVSG